MEGLLGLISQWSRRIASGREIGQLPIQLVAISLALFALPLTTRAQGADTTKPTTPAALTATVIFGSQINLSWTASTDNVGVTGIALSAAPARAVPPGHRLLSRPGRLTAI